MAEAPRVLKVDIYRDKSGEFRWRALAGNNREIADSGEGYTNHGDCAAAVASLYPGVEVQDYFITTKEE